MLRTLIILAIVLAALATWFLTRPAAPKPYVRAYQSALDRLEGSQSAMDEGLARFEAVYADLTHEGIEKRVRELYAERMYFNDTLVTFESRDALVAYLGKTGRNLDHSDVRIDAVIQDGPDLFVRWTMSFSASSMGRSIESESIGMTHLRFDDQGRVVLHQDFWDAATGLYRNLPVIGYGLDLVDRRMAVSHQD